LGVNIGNVETPNNISNFLTLGIFEANDTKPMLEYFFSSIFEEIRNITFLNQTPVTWFFTSDLLFAANSYGHCGSFVTAFPSPICSCPAAQFPLMKKPCNLRTIEDIKSSATLYETLTNGKKPTGKNLASVYKASRGVNTNPMCHIDPAYFIPPSLHIMQGIGNYLVKPLDNIKENGSEEKMKKFLNSIGASREAFAKKDFTGLAIKKICLNAALLRECFPPNLPEVDETCEILQCLSNIYASAKAKFLDDTEIEFLGSSIAIFSDLIKKKPKIFTLTKIHYLLTHVQDFVIKHGFWGLMSEQVTESIHSSFNSSEEDYKNVSKDKQFELILRRQLVKNYCFDTGRGV
jgi:hypothetical protein